MNEDEHEPRYKVGWGWLPTHRGYVVVDMINADGRQYMCGEVVDTMDSRSDAMAEAEDRNARIES